ncbi:hypothetical protein AYY23_21580 [Photobacterium kishitanii]|nr:hypothetical protein AYY23_21580 [Photobacterium kishitanii]
MSGAKVNLNGTFSQFKINVISLDKEHLSSTSKRIIDETTQIFKGMCFDAIQLYSENISNKKVIND